MKKARYNIVNRRHTSLPLAGIALLAFLILVSIASAAQSLNAPNSGGYFLKNMYEKDIKIQDEALELTRRKKLPG
jgi:hypothetical protein